MKLSELIKRDLDNPNGVWSPKKRKKHWWLKDKPFKRVKLSTLYRLALLYYAETGKSASEFVLWLEGYMEDSTN